jgi:hypothetical protein
MDVRSANVKRVKIAMETSTSYVIAAGPDGLKDVLNELLEKSRQDPLFARQEHHVLYQLGNQKTMIRIDTDQAPFKFWCYDLLGRPITVVLKNTLADFLWEHWGEKELRLQDVTDQNK